VYQTCIELQSNDDVDEIKDIAALQYVHSGECQISPIAYIVRKCVNICQDLIVGR